MTKYNRLIAKKNKSCALITLTLQKVNLLFSNFHTEMSFGCTVIDMNIHQGIYFK